MTNSGVKKTRVPIWACFLFLLSFVAVVACGIRPHTAQARAMQPCDGATDRAEITFDVDGKKYFYRDVILPAPDHTVYEQLEHRNINATLEEKIKTVDKCLAAGAQWREAIRYCFPLLPDLVSRIKAETDADPRDSEIRFRPDRRPMFGITRSASGRLVDEKKIYQDIYLALRKSSRVTVTVKPQVILPQVKTEDNIRLTKKISEFSTSFSSSAEGRKNNIRLALSKINGTVLKAGEEFSFNGKVGPRTERNGFSVAKIIVGGEYVEGVGGGVCQASTTLYNAALTAGMKITCVRNHSILPSYVPPSLDSMVNASSSDLKFVNPYPTPVFIKAECRADSAKITFYGAEPEYVIKTVSREISRTPAPQDKEILDNEHKFTDVDSPAGARVRVSYGHSGVKSEGYLRYFTRSGSFVREEKIRTDTYFTTQGVVAVAP